MMTTPRRDILVGVVTAGWLVCLAGCDQTPPTTQKPPPPAPTAKPASQHASQPTPPPAPAGANPQPNVPAKPAAPPASPPNPHANMTPPAAMGAMSPTGNFKHAGINITLPADWVAEPTPTGPMAALASYRLSKVEGDVDDATVRISHYPSMKDKDDPNIDRWLGQVRRADGQPVTRSDAKITKTEMGPVKITVVDVTGTVSMGMMGGGESKPDYRAINVIVDHPNGPHFVRAQGPAKTVAKWEASIEAAVKSATVLP